MVQPYKNQMSVQPRILVDTLYCTYRSDSVVDAVAVVSLAIHL